MSASQAPNKNRPRQSARPAPGKTLQQQLPELRPAQSTALLQELHILTPEGKLNQDTRRQLKPANHQLQFIQTPLQEAPAARGDVRLADTGPGKP